VAKSLPEGAVRNTVERDSEILKLLQSSAETCRHFSRCGAYNL